MKRVLPITCAMLFALILTTAPGCNQDDHTVRAGLLNGTLTTFGPLHTAGRWIRDIDNRVVILRGINLGSRSKLPPFLPFDDTSYLDQIVEWGLNSVRLLFTWEGVEPQEGTYDEQYLEQLAAIIEACAKRNILVILDAHQDIYARNFCGDGFPPWSVHPDYRDETCPAPLRLWPLSYVASPGVIRSFDRFWEDPRLKSAYIRMMLHVVRRLASNPAVIGIDLFNEPFDLSYFLFDGSFERNILIPFYRDLIAGIRAIRPDLTIFYGTTGLFSVGFPTFLEPLDVPNVVFAAHWYDMGSLISGLPSGIDALRNRLAAMVEMATSWGVPVWIGEYGVATDRTDNVPSLASQISLLEAYQVGSAIWTYNPTEVDWNDENTSLVYPGGAEKPHVSVLVRPYPSRLVGPPIRYAYDQRTGTFELEFFADTEANGATEIIIPQRTYPAGFNVEISDGTWSWDSQRRVLFYDTAKDGSTHAIFLRPLH